MAFGPLLFWNAVENLPDPLDVDGETDTHDVSGEGFLIVTASVFTVHPAEEVTGTVWTPSARRVCQTLQK